MSQHNQPRKGQSLLRRLPFLFSTPLNQYTFAALCVALAILIRLALNPFLSENQLALSFFFLAVLATSWFGKLGPAVSCSIAGYIATDWFFLTPGKLRIQTVSDLVSAISYFSITLSIAFFGYLKRKSRQALKRNEEMWSLAIDNFIEGAIIVTEDEKSVYWNDAARKMHGIIGEKKNMRFDQMTKIFQLWDLNGTRKLESDAWPVKRIKRGECLRGLELRLRRPDQGWEKIVSYSGKMVKTTGGENLIFLSIYDLTRQRTAEEALRRSEERFKSERDRLSALINSVNDEVWFADKEKKFTLINAQGLKAFSLRTTGAAIDVEKLAASLEVYDADGSPRPVEDAPPLKALKGEVVRNQEEIIITPDKKERRYRQVSAAPVRDAHGGILGSISVVRDITEQKKAEQILRRDKDTFETLVKEKTQELLQARLELEQAKRLSDIGTLATTVAHELRNPLAGIALATHNIRKKETDPSVIARLSTIDKKIGESNQIIMNLLFYSRLKQPRLENIRLQDVLSEAIRAAKTRLPETATMVENDAPIRQAIVQADPVQLKEVFHNILNNALDAVRDKPEGKIEISANKSDGQVSVAIRDNGIGMDKETLEKASDPFYTTKPRGTGLGLTVSKQIIDLHQGSMELESASGRGTTVTMRLPLKQQKEPLSETKGEKN